MIERADVLIVGGSVGGIRTAEALRRLKFSGSIVVVEESDDLLYDRPALSKQILTDGASPASVTLRTLGGLDKQRIMLRHGLSAVGLDPKARSVTLSDGSSIEYGDLVIATGARPRRLPSAEPRRGVYYLRTLEDALWLRDHLDEARRVVVVGAGFIGSEVAAAAAVRGLDVTIVDPFAFPLSRVLGDVVGERLAQVHGARGVRLELGRSVAELLEAEDGQIVVLDDDTRLPCDLVVVGIGALPNTEWLEGSGLDLGDGVVCDEQLRSSDPHVFAVGDVARWPHPLFGEMMRVEHWTNSVEQSTIVAWNIVNADKPRVFASVPYVWSDQYQHRLQIIGRPRTDDDVRIVHDDVAGDVLVVLYVREDRLVGAFALNAPQQILTLRRQLTSRAPLADVMETYKVSSDT